MAETPTPTPTTETPTPTPTVGQSLFPEGVKDAAEAPAGTTEEGATVTEPAPVVAKESEEPAPKEGEVKTAEEVAAETVLGPAPLAAADVTFPDTLKVDDSLMGDFLTLANEAKLGKEPAQKLADLYVKALESQATVLNSAIQEEFNSTQTKWVAELNAMPDFQGEARSSSLATIGKAFETYGSPAAREAFATTGAGNNPEIVKFVLGMAKALSEGTSTIPGRPSGQSNRPQSLGQAIFGPDGPKQ